MRVRVLFFALYRDLAGCPELPLDVPPSSTAENLVEHLRGLGGGLERLPPRPVLAVNQEFAALSTQLSEGDEVALLPPVAGG